MLSYCSGLGIHLVRDFRILGVLISSIGIAPITYFLKKLGMRTHFSGKFMRSDLKYPTVTFHSAHEVHTDAVFTE